MFTFRRHCAISLPEFIKDIPNIDHSLVYEWYCRWRCGGIQLWYQVVNGKHVLCRGKLYPWGPMLPRIRMKWDYWSRHGGMVNNWVEDHKWTSIRSLDQCCYVGKLPTVPKKMYLSNKIAESGSSQKDLFRKTKNLIRHPRYSPDNDLAISYPGLRPLW